jgi:LysR family transcriptional regulator, glycine cleavage system transcriptional activator
MFGRPRLRQTTVWGTMTRILLCIGWGFSMPLDLPPLVWLRAFEAAARHLSFTDAAIELNLTQAAVSKHVKSLELHLRQPLFIRGPRSLKISKTGEAYLPKVRDAFERLSVGTREVFGGQRTHELTLRCAASFAVDWLAPRLPEFLKNHPRTEIKIISSIWNAEIDPNVYDLDIQYGTGQWRNMRSLRLTWETITPLCTPSLARELSQPDDLRSQRLLHVLGYQEGWGTWLQAAGTTSVNPGQGLKCDTSLMALELASQGGGVALGRHSVSSRARMSGRLVAPFDLEVPIDEAFYLLQPVQSDTHPDASLFAEWIAAVAARDGRDSAS